MTARMPFRRIAIVGVGLIGGSLGLAFKKRDSVVHVRGVGRDRSRLDKAVQMGAIDDAYTEVDRVLKDRDLVILATPVEHILQTLEGLMQYLSPGAVVTDVGSTKRKICRKARECLGTVEFVGGHPLAGREVGGVENSLPDLFRDAPYVLCPDRRTPVKTVRKLKRMVESIGARPALMSVQEHDRILAWTSHLPQLLSTALASVSLKQKNNPETLMRFSGSGFRDVLRLAWSPYSVWQGIIESNSDNIDRALVAFIGQLQQMRRGLKRGQLSCDFRLAAEFYEKYRELRFAQKAQSGHTSRSRKTARARQ